MLPTKNIIIISTLDSRVSTKTHSSPTSALRPNYSVFSYEIKPIVESTSAQWPNYYFVFSYENTQQNKQKLNRSDFVAQHSSPFQQERSTHRSSSAA